MVAALRRSLHARVYDLTLSRVRLLKLASVSCRTHIEFQHIMHVPSILHIISHNVFDVLRSCKRVYDARVYI